MILTVKNFIRKINFVALHLASISFLYKVSTSMVEQPTSLSFCMLGFNFIPFNNLELLNILGLKHRKRMRLYNSVMITY